MGWKKNKIQKKSISFIALLFVSTHISSDFVKESIKNHKEKYEEVAMKIWNYAELGYQENKSAQLLAESLLNEGFSIQRNLAGIPTAFIAEFNNGGPVIGILG